MNKRNRRILPSNERCMGRKLDGLRCTRSRIGNTEFCKSHNRKIPNGRADDGKVFMKDKKINKKKLYEGNDDYIVVYKKTINGETYYIDDDEYIYLNDLHHPKRIGILLNKKINYFKKGIFEYKN